MLRHLRALASASDHVFGHCVGSREREGGVVSMVALSYGNELAVIEKVNV